MQPRPMRRFYLHPNQPLPVIHNQVVPRTLAPGFCHPKSQSRRLCQKRCLRHVTRCFRVNDRVRPNSHRLCHTSGGVHPPALPRFSSVSPCSTAAPSPSLTHFTSTFPNVSPISANRRSFPCEFRQFHTRSARPAPPHPPKGRAASRQLSCQRSIPPFALSFRAKQNPGQAGDSAKSRNLAFPQHRPKQSSHRTLTNGGWPILASRLRLPHASRFSKRGYHGRRCHAI